MPYAAPPFTSFSWNPNAGNVSVQGFDLKQVFRLDSGTSAYYIYDDSTQSNGYLLVAPAADYLNISGRLVENKKNGKFLYDVSTPILQPYNNRFSYYAGRKQSEHFTIFEGFGNSESISAYFYEGGKGRDVAFYPNYTLGTDISVNSLGMCLLRSGIQTVYGSHSNYHMMIGVERVELLDASFDIPSTPRALRKHTYGDDLGLWNSGNVRGSLNNEQVINDKSNLYVLGSFYDGGVFAGFEDPIIDFKGGADILVVPRPRGDQTSLQFVRSQWLLVETDRVTAFVGLEYIAFADMSYRLGPAGVIQEIPWMPL